MTNRYSKPGHCFIRSISDGKWWLLAGGGVTEDFNAAAEWPLDHALSAIASGGLHGKVVFVAAPDIAATEPPKLGSIFSDDVLHRSHCADLARQAAEFRDRFESDRAINHAQLVDLVTNLAFLVTQEK
jgi:hypothetical protein